MRIGSSTCLSACLPFLLSGCRSVSSSLSVSDSSLLRPCPFVFTHIYMPDCLYAHLSICLLSSVCLSVYVFYSVCHHFVCKKYVFVAMYTSVFCLSVCLYAFCLSFCLFTLIFLSLFLYVKTYSFLVLYLSICLPVYISYCLSVYMI